MRNADPIQAAIDIVGLSTLARGLGVTHQAVRKWQRAGRLPRTEWTGETEYAAKIAEMSGGVVLRDDVMSKWNATPNEARNAA